MSNVVKFETRSFLDEFAAKLKNATIAKIQNDPEAICTEMRGLLHLVYALAEADRLPLPPVTQCDGYKLSGMDTVVLPAQEYDRLVRLRKVAQSAREFLR